MSKQTDKNLLIVSSLPGLYQALLSGITDYNELGNRIVEAARLAQAFRRVDKVVELGQLLVNNPIKEYQLIGQYYLAWSKYRGQENQLPILERVIEQSNTYKAKALNFRGALSLYQGRLDEAMFFYLESLRSRTTVSEYITSVQEIAVIKSIEGFKKSALKDLETLLPPLKYAEPVVVLYVLNSYAVELGEAGRKYEARNVINHVLTSPLASVYPQCHATAQELREPNRAFISTPESLPKIERKHVEIETKPAPTSEKDRKPANVLPFQKLKEAPEPEQPERVSPTEWDDMTASEKLDFLMTALRTGAISERHYDNIAAQTGMLKTGPASKVLDLEDETLMTDKLIEWAHMIDPEDLAGVISALRDCDDPTRQASLMDAMIRKFFEYSSACGASEEAWRKKVERRLPKK